MKRKAARKSLASRIRTRTPSIQELWYMAITMAHRPLPSIYEDGTDSGDSFRIYPLWGLGAFALLLVLFFGRPDSDISYLSAPFQKKGFPHRWLYSTLLVAIVLSTTYWIGILVWLWPASPILRAGKAFRKWTKNKWENFADERSERQRKKQWVEEFLRSFEKQ